MSELNLVTTKAFHTGLITRPGVTHAAHYDAPVGLFDTSQMLLCSGQKPRGVRVIIRRASKKVLRARVLCSRCQRLLAPAQKAQPRRKSA